MGGEGRAPNAFRDKLDKPDGLFIGRSRGSSRAQELRRPMSGLRDGKLNLFATLLRTTTDVLQGRTVVSRKGKMSLQGGEKRRTRTDAPRGLERDNEKLSKVASIFTSVAIVARQYHQSCCSRGVFSKRDDSIDCSASSAAITVASYLVYERHRNRMTCRDYRSVYRIENIPRTTE